MFVHARFLLVVQTFDNLIALGLESMGGLGEVHISAAQMPQWQLPQNADSHYCGANLCTSGSPASYFIMLSDHKEQITTYFSTPV
jgi:hypothetical protein